MDWDHFVTHHWAQSPVCMPCADHGISAGQAYQTLVAASAPFRAGTRFFVLPSVRFFVEDAEIRAPGKLLPSEDDRSVSVYLERLATVFGSEHARVEVEQPLVVDYVMWAAVRKLIYNLCERIGFPVLPVHAEFSLGRLDRTRSRSDHAVMQWVLQGRMRVHLNRAQHASTTEEYQLEAGAGDMLYWPADHEAREESTEGCFVLRLLIPSTPASLGDTTRRLLASLLQERLYPEEDTPYLPFPPKVCRNGTTATIEPLERVANALEEAVHGPELEQALRVQWISRVSACGLEPMLYPQDFPAIGEHDRVRLSDGARIMWMRFDEEAMLWAVNGYALAVPNTPQLVHMREKLASGAVHDVGQLSRSDRDGQPDADVLSVLDQLHGLRGIELVAAPEG